MTPLIIFTYYFHLPRSYVFTLLTLYLTPLTLTLEKLTFYPSAWSIGAAIRVRERSGYFVIMIFCRGYFGILGVRVWTVLEGCWTHSWLVAGLKLAVCSLYPSFGVNYGFTPYWLRCSFVDWIRWPRLLPSYDIYIWKNISHIKVLLVNISINK